MGSSLFKRGYDASRAEKERQDKAREKMGKKLFKFFIQEDGGEAEVRFLTEEPVGFYEHAIMRGGKFDSVVCTRDSSCPLCSSGNKATFKGAYIIIDKRPFEYTDKSGKVKKGDKQIRLFVQGMRVVSQLDRISSKYGLSNRDITIVRSGKGTATSYMIEKGDKYEVTPKEISALLPEKLREEYNGTTESLMDIIERQLASEVVNGYTDEDEDDDLPFNESEKMVSLEDEDDDFEEEPKKVAPFKKKKGGLKKA